MKYKDAEKIKVGDLVTIKKDDSNFKITGIRKYEAVIIFESDGGEFYHKDVEYVLN